MKSKKNVFVLLSFFIVVIFILTLFGQKPKLEDRIAALETKVAALETWKSTQKALGPPAYDSDWKSIDRDLKLTHNLGGDPNKYVIDLQFKGYVQGIHQCWYGGNTTVGPDGKFNRIGAFWRNLDGTRIQVTREPHDGNIVWIRVRIWKY